MKYKLLVLLLLSGLLLSSFGTAFAQGSNPSAGNPAAPINGLAAAARLNTIEPFLPSRNSANSFTVTTTPISNPDFELGPGYGWYESSYYSFERILSPFSTPYQLPLTPHSGNFAAWLGGTFGDESSIYQINLSIVSPTHLRFWYFSAGGEPTCGDDLGAVLVNGTPQVTFELCNGSYSYAWYPWDVDLSAFNGQTVTVSIKVMTDGYVSSDTYYGNSNLFIDDVTLYRTFADVPYGYGVESYIQSLYNAGITGGCQTSPVLLYCPNNTVNRTQMAIFLLRGIHGSTYTPPDVGTDTGFADVPVTYPNAAWIKQLAAEGITGGCGGGNFCPTATVSRAAMAIFLLRAKYGSTYTPPDVGTDTGFADVPITYPNAAWIKQLVTEGITAGCGGGNYCPTNPVTRGQMAVFLVRTFSLP